jgi:hypothetical protein
VENPWPFFVNANALIEGHCARSEAILQRTTIATPFGLAMTMKKT